MFLILAIFMKPVRTENQCLYNSDMNLWKSCEAVNLTTNFRINQDSTWNETLNRIRFGEQTEEDKALLRTRYVSNFKSRDHWDDAIHTFYKNEDVMKHNTKMLNKMEGKLIQIDAELPNRKQKPATKHGTIESTNFALKLELKKIVIL